MYKYFSCKKQGDRKQLPKVALFSTILKIVDSNREKEIRAAHCTVWKMSNLLSCEEYFVKTVCSVYQNALISRNFLQKSGESKFLQFSHCGICTT